jgi:replicative DNA helicase
LRKLAAAVGSEQLTHLADSDVYWDEVVSIEPTGQKQVYDLTIPETHNFVANDLCVHNTAFALNLIRNIITGHAPGQQSPVVVFFSLEMARIELAERLLCCQSRVDSHKVRKGHLNQDDIQKLMEAGDVLRKARLYIDDTPSRSMIQIAASCRRIMKKHEKEGGLQLVVIDYLQLIEPENRRDPRQEQVAQISRRLKFLAKELNIPVIALAQVNRSSEDRQDHKPRLSDLRESGSIEQDADTCMMLHRPGMFDKGDKDAEKVLEIIIAKQRNGPTGEITLTYLKQFNRFENYIADVGYGGDGL